MAEATNKEDTMVERVTVAVDGGAASGAALAWVIDRAKTVTMYLEITSVVGLDSDLPSGEDSGYRTPIEEAVADAEARVHAEAAGLAVTTKLRHGVPHEALVAASRHADLLVIGTNKTSPLAGIVHGTLPLKVAGHSECTTVVVPFDWKPSTGTVVAGWVDDPTAEAALDFAAEEAARRATTLAVVSTWTTPPLSAMDSAGSALLVEQVVAANAQLLAGAVHRVQRAHPALTVTQHTQAGSPAVAIVRAAENAVMVVVGSRGRGAIAGFLLGSVSHDLLLNMPAPVAVVPRKEEPIDVYPDLVDDDI
jgi:nucleotide-binding universal stress UspA family protein